jgi:hypothetical protein
MEILAAVGGHGCRLRLWEAGSVWCSIVPDQPGICDQRQTWMCRLGREKATCGRGEATRNGSRCMAVTGGTIAKLTAVVPSPTVGLARRSQAAGMAVPCREDLKGEPTRHRYRRAAAGGGAISQLSNAVIAP